ncbi:MAG: hypothetical protein AABY30_02545, partial [Candidatus Thermoplasmatota archaeon]
MTWDVDSRDRAMCARVRRFVFGTTFSKGGRTYRYPGFVEREGVRYLGQSVLFVTPDRFRELASFLHRTGVPHVVTGAALG